MSEELSRVKSRQKQYNAEGQSSVKGKNRFPSPAPAPQQSETYVSASTGTLSRKSRHSAPSAKQTVERQGEGNEGESTPSRAQSYPSERIRLSKMFINSLIVIFLLLLASLLWWGIEGAPELGTLW